MQERLRALICRNLSNLGSGKVCPGGSCSSRQSSALRRIRFPVFCANSWYKRIQICIHLHHWRGLRLPFQTQCCDFNEISGNGNCTLVRYLDQLWLPKIDPEPFLELSLSFLDPEPSHFVHWTEYKAFRIHAWKTKLVWALLLTCV